MSEGGGFFDADEIVFEPKEGFVELFFMLVVFGDDTGAIFKNEGSGGGIKGVFQMGENAAAEVIEAFAVGLADFAQKETFETGTALTIVGAHLGEEPVGFSAAASAAIADGSGAIGQVAKPGSGAGGELTRLENDPGADKVFHLVGRAPGGKAVAGILLGVEFVTHKRRSYSD